jgi:hypothetical protein
VAPARAECAPVESRPCILTLGGKGAPAASASCGGEAWKPHLEFLQPDRFADEDHDAWWETVVKLDLGPGTGCTCAVFRLSFLDEPALFAVDIGNSPTNDGMGGDASSTRHDAELQIFKKNLRLYSADAQMGTPFHDILDLILPNVTGRSLDLEICDQTVRFRLAERREDQSPWGGEVKAHATQTLFRLGTQPSGLPFAPPERHSLYAAFHRVIDRVDGPSAKRRFGKGVARVELFLRP